MTACEQLRAPFPWWGGKARAADIVWTRFGNVPNYVEPFFGSGAVLLRRPHHAKTETVNDIDCFVANFWRAVTADPAGAAKWADSPVNEADLHARHRWLVNRDKFREKMKTDPDYYDVKIAGWWVWGICLWIGSGWCSNTPGQKNGSLFDAKTGRARRIRDVGNASRWEKRPVLGRGGRGVTRQLPQLSGDGSGAGRGVLRRLGEGGLEQWMMDLAARLRETRVCCGDWTRITGPAVTTHIGVTGVFLDPPYSDKASRDPSLYAHDCGQVAHAVREWAIANGDDPKLRIGLCGYEGEHDMPETWECVSWKANGGYANSNVENQNAHRERIWFSPHCLRPQAELFDIK